MLEAAEYLSVMHKPVQISDMIKHKLTGIILVHRLHQNNSQMWLKRLQIRYLIANMCVAASAHAQVFSTPTYCFFTIRL